MTDEQGQELPLGERARLARMERRRLFPRGLADSQYVELTRDLYKRWGLNSKQGVDEMERQDWVDQQARRRKIRTVRARVDKKMREAFRVAPINALAIYLEVKPDCLVPGYLVGSVVRRVTRSFRSRRGRGRDGRSV